MRVIVTKIWSRCGRNIHNRGSLLGQPIEFAPVTVHLTRLLVNYLQRQLSAPETEEHRIPAVYEQSNIKNYTAKLHSGNLSRNEKQRATSADRRPLNRKISFDFTTKRNRVIKVRIYTMNELFSSFIARTFNTLV